MHRISHLALAALAAAFLAGPTSAQTAERGDLALTFKEGDTSKYAITVGNEQGLGMDGGASLSERIDKTRITVSQTVKSVGEDGKAVVEAEVEAIKVTTQAKAMGMAQPPMEYDSAATEDGAATGMAKVLAILRHAVGKTFTYTVSPTGEVSGVSGGEELRKAIADGAEKELAAILEQMGGQGGGQGGGGMGGMLGGMNRGQMVRGALDQFTAMFRDENLQGVLNSVMNLLPDDGKGEAAWTRKRKDDLPFLGALDYTCKIERAGDADGMTRLSVGIDGEVAIDRTSGEQQQQGNPMLRMVRMMMKNMEVKTASVEGTATVASGQLSDSEIVRAVVVEGPAPPMLAAMGGGGGQDAKMQIKSTTTYRCEVLE